MLNIGYLYQSRYNLRAQAISHIYMLLSPELSLIVADSISSRKESYTPITIEANLDTLDVDVTTAKPVDKDLLSGDVIGAHPAEVGKVLHINEETRKMVLIASLAVSVDSIEPVIITQLGSGINELCEPHFTQLQGMVVQKGYYSSEHLPKNTRIASMSWYRITIDVALQQVISYEDVYGSCPGRDPIVVRRGEKEGTVETIAYCANGGFNIPWSPMRLDQPESLSRPASWMATCDISVYAKMTTRAFESVFGFNYGVFNRSRFGKLYLHLESDIAHKKLDSKRIDLDDNDRAFYTWWFNHNAVDPSRKIDERPSPLSQVSAERYGYVVSELETADYSFSDHAIRTLPRITGQKWAEAYTFDSLVALLQLAAPMNGNPSTWKSSADQSPIFCHHEDVIYAKALQKARYMNTLAKQIEDAKKNLDSLTEKFIEMDSLLSI